MQITNKQFIIFVGRSGSGKGTQSKLLSDYFTQESTKNDLIITGDIFRAMMQLDNPTSVIAKSIYDKGGRHPDFLALSLIGKYFFERYDASSTYIVDGAARSYYEAVNLIDIARYYSFDRIKVVYINVSYEWSIDKLKLRGRNDDNEHNFLIKKHWFENEVLAAIEYFRENQYVDFVEIDGEKPINDIHAEIIAKIK